MQKTLKTAILGAILGLSASSIEAQEFKAVPLGPQVNTEYDEVAPRLSPDDQYLYFVRTNHPANMGGRGAGQDIWVSEQYPDGSWSTATNVGEPL
ncbi:MAG: OmpA family protein, partial [Bacteroidota bacterium]